MENLINEVAIRVMEKLAEANEQQVLIDAAAKAYGIDTSTPEGMAAAAQLAAQHNPGCLTGPGIRRPGHLAERTRRMEERDVRRAGRRW